MNSAYSILGLLVIGLLSGCGNDPHPEPWRKVREDGSPWVVVYRGFPDDPRTLDPQVSYDTLGHAVIGQLYESILDYDLFQTNPYKLVPCLVESLPERVPVPEGREDYVLHLKKGIRFHDDPCFPSGVGRELTASDLEYVFKRMADPRVECPVASVFQEFIVGFKEAFETAEKSNKFDYSRSISGVEVVDRYTLRLHLTKVYPQIQYWLAMPFTAPVPREAVEYYDGQMHDGLSRPLFKFHPVGTGAFRLAEWNRSQLMRLVRNEHYDNMKFPDGGWDQADEARFRPLAGKKLPLVDEVQWNIIRESIPGWLLFKQGYLDSSGISKDVFNTVLSSSLELTPEYISRGVRLRKDVEPGTFYLILNMEDEVLGKNKKLRQALSSEYDEDLENEIFYNGIELNAQQILPPGVFGHMPDYRNPYKQHDLVLARKLIAEAGYPNGIDPKTGKALKLTLDIVADDASSRQHAEFIKNQLEQIGIKIEVSENTWARQQDKVDSGHYQIAGGSGWHADYPDPENFLFLFASKNKPPQGSNHCRYANPEFDALFDQLSRMDNSPERLELIKKANDMLVEDCPVVYNMHPVSFALLQPWSPPLSGNSLISGGLKFASVDPELREVKRKEWNKPVLWPILLVGSGIILLGTFVYTWSRNRYV